MDFSFVDEPFLQYDKNSEEATIVTSPFFTVSKMEITENKILFSSGNSFRILICIEGECSILNQNIPVIITKGHTVLLPAALSNIEIKPHVKTKLLEVHID